MVQWEKAILVMIFAVCMGGVVLLGGRLLAPNTVQAQTDTPVLQVLKAQRIELVDATGKARMVMSVDSQGTALLAISDSAGTNRASLSVDKEGKSTLYTSQKQVKPESVVQGGTGLECGDYQLIKERGTRYIVGTVKNTTDAEMKFVQLNFNLYDETSAQVDTTSTSINNLESNGTWKFRIPIARQSVVSCKLKELLGFPK